MDARLEGVHAHICWANEVGWRAGW